MDILALLKSPWKLKLFMLSKLPMGVLAGLKIVEITEDKAIVSIRYGYFTKNPFQSVYFACLAMAGELASGALGLVQTQGKKPNISMLVVSMEAQFHKKAKGLIKFECLDGNLIKAAVEKTKATGEGVTVVATSTGKDVQGQVVATFHITWSFKVK